MYLYVDIILLVLCVTIHQLLAISLRLLQIAVQIIIGVFCVASLMSKLSTAFKLLTLKYHSQSYCLVCYSI